MSYRLKTVFLSLLFCLFALGCVDRKEIDSVPASSLVEDALSDDKLVAITYQYFKSEFNKYQLSNPADRLVLQSVVRDQYQTQHLKFASVYEGVSVWGWEVLAHIKNSEVYRIDGNVISDQFTVVNTGSSKIKPAEAEEVALQATSSERSKSTLISKLVIFPEDLISGRFSYEVQITTGLSRYIVIIDALDGNVLKIPDVMPKLTD